MQKYTQARQANRAERREVQREQWRVKKAKQRAQRKQTKVDPISPQGMVNLGEELLRDARGGNGTIESPTPDTFTGVNSGKLDMPPSEDMGEPEQTKYPGLSARDSKLVNEVARAYAGIALLLYTVAPADATVLMQKSDEMAQSLVGVAKHHPGMMRALRRIVAGNDYVTFGSVHLGFLIAVLNNHAMLPHGLTGLFKKTEQKKESAPASAPHVPSMEEQIAIAQQFYQKTVELEQANNTKQSDNSPKPEHNPALQFIDRRE